MCKAQVGGIREECKKYLCIFRGLGEADKMLACVPSCTHIYDVRLAVHVAPALDIGSSGSSRHPRLGLGLSAYNNELVTSKRKYCLV